MKIFFGADSEVSASDGGSGGSGFYRGIVLKGKGGTGKSTTVNSIMNAFFLVRVIY